MNRTPPTTETTPVGEASTTERTSPFDRVSPGQCKPLPPTEEAEVVAFPQAPSVSDQVPSLVLLGGALSRRFPLSPAGPQVVGKAPGCQIYLNVSRMSRRHCQLEVSGDDVSLRDLGSTNGTLVNGRQVQQHLLRDGDRIQAGEALLVFVKAGSMRRFRRNIADQRGRQSTISGTCTRRQLMQLLDHEVIRAVRYRRPLCLAALGITDLQKIKERHGPWSGGRILQQLALVIRECLRKADSLARLDDEELAIILPEVPLVGALAVGDKVCRLAADTGFTVDQDVIQVTLKVGLVSWEPFMAGATDLLEAARAKLRQARQEGHG